MQNNQTHEQLRIKANELFNNKWDVTTICKTLNCSKRWFYKWLKRYRSNPTGKWYLEESKKPKNQ